LNILRNSGFETPALESWSKWIPTGTGAQIVEDTTKAATGLRSAKVEVINYVGNTVSLLQSFQDLIPKPIQLGATYRVRATYQGDKWYLGVWVYDKMGTVLNGAGIDKVQLPATIWTQTPYYTLPKLPIQMARITVNIQMRSNGIVNTDDVEVDYTPSPNPQAILTLSSEGHGRADLPFAEYSLDVGDSVSIPALSNIGWQLDHWLIDGVTYEPTNPLQLLMDTSHTVTAIFTLLPPTQRFKKIHAYRKWLVDEANIPVHLTGMYALPQTPLYNDALFRSQDTLKDRR